MPQAEPAGTNAEKPDKNDGQFAVRHVRADTLRDYPGYCFGSSNFKFFPPGASWHLAPCFCGVSTCVTDGFMMLEQITSCKLPKPNAKCQLSNLAAVQAVEPFP